MISERCPYVRISGPSDLANRHPAFINKNFTVQENTLISERPLYVQEDNGTMLFLYYKNNEWRVGEMFGDAQPMAYVINSVGSPEAVSNAWFILEDSGYVSTPDLKLTCERK